MRIFRSIEFAGLAFLAAAAPAAADTGFGPTVGVDSGLPAHGNAIAGLLYASDYGTLYLRVNGAYSPMPPPPPHAPDWPPPSEREDRGYASCELLGAHFPGGSAALGLGLYYKFGRGESDYSYSDSGPIIISRTEDFVAFKHDALAVAACRIWAAGKRTAVAWGGVGLSHFRRHGLRYYYASDYYEPEYTYEVFTPLDTRLTSLAAGVGIDVRVRFAGPFGAYGYARGVVPVADIYLQGYDRSEPGANVAFAAGGLVGW